MSERTEPREPNDANAEAATPNDANAEAATPEAATPEGAALEAGAPEAGNADAAASEAEGSSPRRFWRLPVQQALQQAWADAKQASQGVEDELRKRARAMLERAGVTQGGEDVQGLVGELRERLQRSRQEFEQKLHGSVQSAIERVQQPLVAEIAALKDRAEALGERLNGLRSGKPDSEGVADGEEPTPPASDPEAPRES